MSVKPSSDEKSKIGSRKRGRDQIDRIIENSKEILIKEGYGAFTIRNISKSLGISPGTLTYYFPRKEDLFKTLFVDLVEKQRLAINKKIEAFSGDEKAMFMAMVETFVDECKDEFTRAYFYQLWAGSVYDPFLESLRKDIYAQMFSEVEEALKPLMPGISKQALKDKTFIFCSMIEGLHVTLGSHSSQVRKYLGFEKEFNKVVLSLLD